MKCITDKLLVVILGITLFAGGSISPLPVISLLLAICVSALIQYFGKGKISLVAEILYLILCIAEPKFLFFLPTIFYDILTEKRFFLLIPTLMLFIRSAVLDFGKNTLFLLLCFSLAFILRRRTEELARLEKLYIESRDSSTETNMLLTTRNKAILENQDNEIHLATLRERNRIAREIHDNVGHMLSRSILQLGAMQIICKDDAIKGNLTVLRDTLNKAMTDIRHSVHNLHDDSIDLKQSVRDAVKPLEDKEIKVVLSFDIKDNIPGKLKLCFISVIKEAVSNIIRHSNADKTVISIAEHPAFYKLLIEDNGKCIGTIKEGGIGLLNMRERIEGLGGIFSAESGEKGFRIFITVRKDSENENCSS